MSNYAIVSNKKELKQALNHKIDQIIITNPDLARNIKLIKLTSKTILATAIAGAAVTATNFWNPVGWTVGFASAAVSGSTIAAIVALGIGTTLVWIIYNDYTVKAKGKAKLPDGTEVEAELILEKNRKSS